MIADLVRECARCGKVLVDQDEHGWYYQVPVTDPIAPGLTFMDRVYRCGGPLHDVRPHGERLALHLVSAHCDGMAIARSHPENVDQHAYEHRGPGTIRNHPLGSLIYDDQKIEQVLEELEEEETER
jgi:hypothetical protein